MSNIPFRLDLSGGWLDQPFVSKLYSGSVLTISLEPVIEYKERSGMATSTRKAIQELWPKSLPDINPETLAKLAFDYENCGGSEYVSGAQDSIGICMPGLTRHFYEGKYWPLVIGSCHDNDILDWIEEHVFLKFLFSRPEGLDLLTTSDVTFDKAGDLSIASRHCWDGILDMDLRAFADGVRWSFEAQVAMFPNMVNAEIWEAIRFYGNDILGWKLAGAGGGGYLVLIAEDRPAGASKIKIRRR
jgi:galactokinase/mevalonate kinase-like predicted kinase